MFFLGHMSWAVICSSVFSWKSKNRLFIPVILMLGVLPDVDLFLGGYGIEHHTFFHSIFFWVALFLPVIIFFRWRAVPYLIAVLQHFAFGDFLVGELMLFWPFDFSYFGFNTNMLSIFDVVLELTGLFLAFGILYFNGDLRRLVSNRLTNVLMGFPLLALVSSMLFFAVDWPIIPLINHVSGSPLITAILLGHLILVSLFVISTFQGFQKLKFWLFA